MNTFDATMTIDAPPQSGDAPQSGRLPHLSVLRFSGPDSLSFLQGQVSNDTRRLAENRSLFAAFSSPQGRVLALMHLLPHSSGVIAILPRELVLPTLEGLRKFVLRAKVKIEDAGELLSVAGIHDSRLLQSAGFLEEAGFLERAEVMDITGRRHRGLLSGADLAAWRASSEPPASSIGSSRWNSPPNPHRLLLSHSSACDSGCKRLPGLTPPSFALPPT